MRKDTDISIITNSNFPHQKTNCAQTVSDVAWFSIWFLAPKKNAPGRLWSGNCRRSVGLPGSLCFAMFRWIRAWTIEPPGGSGILAGTLPLRRTTQWCITLQKTQRKHQRVRKCPLKYLNPPWGEYGKTRSSNIETAKQSDFPQAVSDKAISRHSFGYSGS